MWFPITSLLCIWNSFLFGAQSYYQLKCSERLRVFLRSEHLIISDLGLQTKNLLQIKSFKIGEVYFVLFFIYCYLEPDPFYFLGYGSIILSSRIQIYISFSLIRIRKLILFTFGLIRN